MMMSHSRCSRSASDKRKFFFLIIVIIYIFFSVFDEFLTQTGDRQREFAMAAASVGDSVGIALAGLAAFPVHRYFCSL